MPDYAAVFLPGQTWTSKAAGTVTGGDPLEVAGVGQVQKCAGASSPKYVGIAAEDATAGAFLTVISNKPTFDGIAEGTVTAGDQVVASAVAGKQVKSLPASNIDVGGSFVQATINTAINAGLNAVRAVIGVALTTASDGQTVRWIQK